MSRRTVHFAHSLSSVDGHALGAADASAIYAPPAEVKVTNDALGETSVDHPPAHEEDRSVGSGREVLEASIREARRESEASYISESYRSNISDSYRSGRESHNISESYRSNISDSYRSNVSDSYRSGGSGGSGSGSRTTELDQSRESDRTPMFANTGSRRANAAAVANDDGPSLAAALAQSIKHHSRLIDGEAPLQQGTRNVRPAYDDDDHVTLAPNVELRYGRDETRARRGEGAAAIMLTDYVANAGSEMDDGAAPLTFVAPPASSFRTVTRHPSHLPADQFETERRAAPRRMLAAKKRHRRTDSFLRLMVAVLCFGLSLAFAIYFGEGRFGLAVSTLAFERKVAKAYGDTSPDYDDPGLTATEEEAFHPEWWESERGIPDMASRGVKLLPSVEYHSAEVSSPRAPERIETPFFWFVPNSGGNAIRVLMARCLRLAEASEYGAGTEAEFLRVEVRDDRKFVNVDMSTAEGRRHAKDLGLVESGVPDVVISKDMHGTLDVFNNRNRARSFAILRHPLERAISKYHSALVSDPNVAGMTLTQYIRSAAYLPDNYLTRFLSGRYRRKLGLEHLDIAREILRRKFVVGLASDLPASMNMFSHVFNWNVTAASQGLQNVDACFSNIYSALSDKSPPSVEEGSEGWKMLVAQNWFDLKLYEYAEHLFQVQVDQLKLTGSVEALSEMSRG
ncbi:hypothetical protein ACHAXT_004495 [Thalassiosira profunda]